MCRRTRCLPRACTDPRRAASRHQSVTTALRKPSGRSRIQANALARLVQPDAMGEQRVEIEDAALDEAERAPHAGHVARRLALVRVHDVEAAPVPERQIDSAHAVLVVAGNHQPAAGAAERRREVERRLHAAGLEDDVGEAVTTRRRQDAARLVVVGESRAPAAPSSMARCLANGRRENATTVAPACAASATICRPEEAHADHGHDVAGQHPGAIEGVDGAGERYARTGRSPVPAGPPRPRPRRQRPIRRRRASRGTPRATRRATARRRRRFRRRRPTPRPGRRASPDR